MPLHRFRYVGMSHMIWIHWKGSLHCVYLHFISPLVVLLRKQFWAARVPNTSQCAGTDPTVTLCSIKFSVCGPLPAFSCGFEKTAGFCQNIDHSGLVKQHETGKQTLILNETSGCIACTEYTMSKLSCII